MKKLVARGRPFSSTKKFADSDTRTRRLARVATQLAKVPISAAHAEVLVRAYLDLVFRQVKGRGRYLVPDFGVFYLRQSKGRTVRNPSTGEPMQLPARWALAFRCAKSRKGVA